MNKSETIRDLGRQGRAVADIARQVGVRYQFARNVLLAAGLINRKARTPSTGKVARAAKPPLQTDHLLRSGFEYSSRWLMSAEGALVLERPLPKSPGVYARAKDGRVLYVGLATMGLAKRLYFYARPGKTQATSQRINKLLTAELQTLPFIDIYTASPAGSEWNGLPVNSIAGLELGLIEGFLLPWNIRGVRP